MWGLGERKPKESPLGEWLTCEMGAPLVRMLVPVIQVGDGEGGCMVGRGRGLLKEWRGAASPPVSGLEVEGLLTLKNYPCTLWTMGESL